MRNWQVLDAETGIHNRGEDAVGKNKASPFHKDNKVCYFGITEGDVGRVALYEHVPEPNEQTKLVVGANVKFDLLYLMRVPAWRDWLKTGRIFDIQLAEYLITGQESKWAKLDDMAVKYGGTVKDDRLKEFWDNGVDTEDIDEDIIKPYLQGDVENTELVFKAQVALAKEMDMLPLMWEQMDGLLATTEMEFNGMQFDKAECMRKAQVISVDVAILESSLNKRIADVLSIPYLDANCSSIDQVSKTLFGGTMIDRVSEDVLNDDGTPYRFKSGKRKGEVKTVLKNVDRKVAGFGFRPEASWFTKKGGVFKVNDDVLKRIKATHLCTMITDEFLDNLAEFRKLNKDLKTYYINYSDLTWPDGRIHPSINHCATATGRLSCSAPNLQNAAHKKED